jgi:hypothetical protein
MPALSARLNTPMCRAFCESVCARFRNWRVYGEEGLPTKEATLWLEAQSLTLEYGGQPLSRYDVRFVAGTEELRTITRPRLFETSHALPQPKLFWLDALGERGWLKVLNLPAYAPRKTRRPRALSKPCLLTPMPFRSAASAERDGVSVEDVGPALL